MADRIIDVHIVHIVTDGDYINQLAPSDHNYISTYDETTLYKQLCPRYLLIGTVTVI